MLMPRNKKRGRNSVKLSRPRARGPSPSAPSGGSARPVASQQAHDAPLENEIAAARAALHDAAKTLAALARSEPRFYPRGPQEPRPPLSPGRVVHVFPTSHNKLDVENLEKAILEAGPGGTVLLKATDKSGEPRHFDLSMVDEIFMEHEVTLKSEKNAKLKMR